MANGGVSPAATVALTFVPVIVNPVPRVISSAAPLPAALPRPISFDAAKTTGFAWIVGPVIVIPGDEWDDMAETTLADHCFSWGPGLQDAAIVFGHGSFYNHSYSPNARFERLPDERLMQYVARRAIAAGEEITINYHEGQESQAPLWFDVT